MLSRDVEQLWAFRRELPGLWQGPMRGEGKLPEQFERKVSLAGSSGCAPSGCAFSALMLSAALVSLVRFSGNLLKSIFLKKSYPSSLSCCKLPMQSTERDAKNPNKFPGRKLPFLLLFVFPESLLVT